MAIASHTNLRFIRRLCEMSQDELAAAIGVDRSAISRFERGELTPSAAVKRKLAAALELEPSELLRKPE